MKTIKEICVSSALNRLKRKIPYKWDLNIYRGCNHGCQYCYAMYSHKYLGQQDFTNTIFVKTNIVELLEHELRSNSWKNEIINIGGVTDSYQDIEKDYKIMPEVLRLLIKYKTPAIISTKSNLILRDIDLIAELAKSTYVNIASTITTMSSNDTSKIEPNASSSLARFEMLRELSRHTSASIGLHVMPIIPYITDNYTNIERIMYNGNYAKVDYVLCGTLYLRGKTKISFLDFVRNNYPDRYENIKVLYTKGSAPKQYKDQLYAMVNQLRERYNLSSSYMKKIHEAKSKGLIP